MAISPKEVELGSHIKTHRGTVPNEQNRRVIVDLSFAFGKGVKDGITKNEYLGEEIQLKYATVDYL